jgi:hypothetical protein
MTDPGVAVALDIFASTPATLSALLTGVPDEITATAADGGWSSHDVVAHLASLDPLTMVGRVRAIVEQDDPVLAEIDEQDVLARSGMRTRSLAAVLDEMARQRTEALGWLRELTPEMLARTGRHSAMGPLSAAEIICHKGWHDLLHVQQICRMLAIPLDAGSGAMRRYH